MPSKPKPVEVRVEFFLEGEIPGFKNRKRISTKSFGRSCKPRLYTQPDVAALLSSLTMQARLRWHGRKPVTDAVVCLTFHVMKRHRDLGNCEGGVMDSLVKAGVLVNDSMAHVKREELDFVIAKDGREGVRVLIDGIEASDIHRKQIVGPKHSKARRNAHATTRR